VLFGDSAHTGLRMALDRLVRVSRDIRAAARAANTSNTANQFFNTAATSGLVASDGAYSGGPTVYTSLRAVLAEHTTWIPISHQFHEREIRGLVNAIVHQPKTYLRRTLAGENQFGLPPSQVGPWGRALNVKS
jgi:hypothetical protein